MLEQTGGGHVELPQYTTEAVAANHTVKQQHSGQIKSLLILQIDCLIGKSVSIYNTCRSEKQVVCVEAQLKLCEIMCSLYGISSKNE